MPKAQLKESRPRYAVPEGTHLRLLRSFADALAKQAKLHGERELRVHHVAIWRESTLFSPRERAALAWTEALTRIPEDGVSDALHDRVRTQLSDKEISDLTYEVIAINGWNRANVAFRTVPDSLDKSYGLDKAGLA